MKKLLIGLFIILLPSISLAASITKDPVGTCRVIKDGYWQQMPDGTWAAPGDRLNTCTQNGSVWNYNNYNSLLNSYPYQSTYNPELARMTYNQWFIMCVAMSSIIPQQECQGYNPMLRGGLNNYGAYNNYLQYPSLGRNYLATGGNNFSLTVESDDSNSFWKSALIGVGMGWLLNSLTS